MQNTVSKYTTRFLAGTELIEKARDKFSVPSENWTYPTRITYGFVAGNYYAEVKCCWKGWRRKMKKKIGEYKKCLNRIWEDEIEKLKMEEFL